MTRKIMLFNHSQRISMQMMSYETWVVQTMRVQDTDYYLIKGIGLLRVMLCLHQVVKRFNRRRIKLILKNTAADLSDRIQMTQLLSFSTFSSLKNSNF